MVFVLKIYSNNSHLRFFTSFYHVRYKEFDDIYVATQERRQRVKEELMMLRKKNDETETTGQTVHALSEIYETTFCLERFYVYTQLLHIVDSLISQVMN